MTYTLKKVTIQTNNSSTGLKQINNLWQDIFSHKIPLLMDDGHQLISRYSHYQSDQNGDYDLSIMSITDDFIVALETKVKEGFYKKYQTNHEDLVKCTQNAWLEVWQDQDKGLINRTFTKDFESSLPAFISPDKLSHCILYIAIK